MQLWPHWFEAVVQRHRLHRVVVLAYVACVVLFLVSLAQFYIPGKGFSYLISFGATQEGTRISKVRRLDRHVERASAGYDAQFYVQIAMDPSLRNSQLPHAVDSLPYRGRRILFATTAYLLGLGHPVWILQAFALQNALAWLLLAALLLHWFPPRSWDNFLRWAGVLFSLGLCLSVRNALFDGPSLLVIAFGLYLLDRGQPWAAAAVLGLGGLGKETNLLGATALAPPWRGGRSVWGTTILRGLLVAVPFGLWLVYLGATVGPVADAGRRNFSLPFVGYMHHWQDLVAVWPNLSWADPNALWNLLSLLALTVQFLFLALRPRWHEAWWRVGAGFAVLLIFIGDAVWEGYPGAATRVLLPMQLAFNVLVPAGRGWRIVLLLGNLTLLAAPPSLQAPLDDGQIKGPSTLLFSHDGEPVTLQSERGWYSPEGGGSDTWVWTTGPALLSIDNPKPEAMEFRLRFGLSSAGHRTIRVVLNGATIWRTELSDRDVATASLLGQRLNSGRNTLEFISDEPACTVGIDPRPLAFSVRNLRIDLQRLLPPAATR
ncbi:MAG: hypothetical protein ACHQ5A_08190 [Opitutales bacterium]